MSFSHFFIIIFITITIFGCVEKTTYSGKIITQNDLSNININNKKELIEKFGYPSYFDNIENKYFYYTEKIKAKNFYNKKIEYSYLFIFQLDQNDYIIGRESINLLNNDVGKYQKKRNLQQHS